MSNQDFEIEKVSIEEEMSRSYVNYAMSVIISRALPDVRDGLKPVQRRILYAMKLLNLGPDSRHTKSAKVAGDTQGNFHPHGQEVIYPTLVRMAQPFSLRYPLLDGQGNFGNVDGDPPAQMRYTEVRLTPIATEMLEDIDRETVPWEDNYLQDQKEPVVLPGKFPNLLCNGVQGIAVGMATNMPPHNLVEVCNAILHRINEPTCTLEEIHTFIKGPDFPTYGIIFGHKGTWDMYSTGRGSVTLQAKTMIEPSEMGKSTIVITEIPYQVNKTTLIKNIADIAKHKKFDGILRVDDYSDKRGMRVEVELRRDVQPNKALKYLLKHTQLRTTFGAIMLSLVDGSPRVSPLLILIDEYIKHRKNVIELRTKYDLYRALEEVHLNEGFQIARYYLDEIIKLIRSSQDPNTARTRMVREFDMSPFQANAVLAMPLRRLTQLEQTKLEADYKASLLKVQNLMDILSNLERLIKVLRDEITTLRDKHGDTRRTKIVATEADDINEDELIPEEEVIIAISRDGYIKRMSMDTYREQKRGGKGVMNTLKATDEPAHLFQVNTHHYILFLTNKGRVFRLRTYDIEESKRINRGLPVVNYINITSEERVTATVTIPTTDGEGYLAMVTQKGEIKRTELTKFANIRSNGIIAFDIEEGDELKWVLKTSGKDDIILISHEGQSIRFKEEDLRNRSRTAGGVRGIRLGKDDFVVSAAVVDLEATLLVVGEKGYGKRTLMKEYRLQGRGGSGILTMKCTEKTGKIVGAEVVDDDNKLILMTSTAKAIRIQIKDIKTVGRNTQGVKLIDLGKSDVTVKSIARVVQGVEVADMPRSNQEDEEQEDLVLV